MIGRHSEAEASAEGAHLVDGRLVERRRNMRIRRFMAEVATFLFVVMMVMSPVLAKEMPVPEKPSLYVKDDAGVLNVEQKDDLDEMLKKYDKETGNQIAVLLVRTTGDEPIEKYSYKVASGWGIGQQGNDNGILITIATEDHKDRIEVGKGLESEVTDSRAGRILRTREVTRAFRRKRWNDGIRSIVSQLQECIRTKGRSADYRTPLASWMLVLPFSVPLLISAICCVADLREGDRKKYRKRAPVFAGIALLEATMFVIMFIAPSAFIFFAAAAGTWILPFFAMMASAIWQRRRTFRGDRGWTGGSSSSQGGSGGGSSFGGGSFGGGGASGGW